jgi:hypothetical protein
MARHENLCLGCLSYVCFATFPSHHVGKYYHGALYIILGNLCKRKNMKDNEKHQIGFERVQGDYETTRGEDKGFYGDNI